MIGQKRICLRVSDNSYLLYFHPIKLLLAVEVKIQRFICAVDVVVNEVQVFDERDKIIFGRIFAVGFRN